MLFFVHGFNCSIDNAIAMVGQLLALGSFPPHIKPFIFAWPCTSGPFYPLVRSLSVMLATRCLLLCPSRPPRALSSHFPRVKVLNVNSA